MPIILADPLSPPFGTVRLFHRRFYDYQGGFFRNTVRDEKADKGQSAGGRIRAIYLPSDNWKVDLNINYEYSDQGGYPVFLPRQPGPPKHRASR